MAKAIQDYLQEGIALTPAVTAFLLREGEVLLMRRKKTQMGLGKGVVSGIGGKVGDEAGCENETHEDALVRELDEEIGIVPLEYSAMGRVRFIWLTKPKWNMDVKVYTISRWEGTPHETEVAEPRWYKTDQLPESEMWPDNLIWVPKVFAGDKIDTVFLLGEDAEVMESVSY